MTFARIWWSPIWTLILIKVLTAPDNHVSCEGTEDLVSTTEVEALVGTTAMLPCDITPDTNDDRVYMVLWFRDPSGKPIYSFDGRGRPLNTSLHWSDQQCFGDRAFFISLTHPATLDVLNIELDDEGIYRCRVDFKNTPTKNFQIRLKVIVPPHQMLLYDEAGRDTGGVIGPLEEGGNFTLLCELRGGHPQPTLKWLVNSTPIEEHTILKNDGTVVVSKISLTGAERNWLNSTVRCQAKNTILISPHERSARIEMNLRPTSVDIVFKPVKMYAGKEEILMCVAHGSRPPAEITWYIDNRQYHFGEKKDYVNDTSTVSQLKFNPSPEDHNVTMKCRADNVLLSASLDDAFVMHVVYKPVVNLNLGSTLQPNEIKEGDDIYFECNVKANPKEYRINWYHDTGFKKLISKTPRRQGGYLVSKSARIFTSSKSLVLQRVDRSHIGLYSCMAANEMGETSSPELYLRIQFAPICSQTSPILIGARIDEQLRIRCTVRADPANVTFNWLFNNSGGSFEVSPHRYGPNFMVSHGGTASELRYQASSERDYGTLTCLTKNIVGAQSKPCIFQVVPAARPSAPRNCTTLKVPRQADPLLAIRCLAGYDGGTRQHFTLESTGQHPKLLVNTSTGYKDGRQTDLVVWFNVTWSNLEDIPEDEALMITAHNFKGASDPIYLHGIVFKNPDKKIEKVGVAYETRVPVAVSLIGLVAIFAGAGAAAAYFCHKRPEITSATAASKRPSQSVVQLDDRGRRYMFTYDTPDKDAKPDILLPKTDATEMTSRNRRKRPVGTRPPSAHFAEALV